MPVGPNMEISSKFNWQYGISKMVSLSIRKLREVNLCGFFDFGSTGPNSGN